MTLRKILQFLNAWAPPFILIGIIFVLSEQQSIAVTHEYTKDFIIFKTLHMLEYGLMTLLFYRSLHLTTKLPHSQKILLAFIFAISYGALDEFHQTFVPTRTGKVRDIFIDGAGISTMSLLLKKRKIWIEKLLRYTRI